MVNKVAIVTGSNKGIGYGIVKELLARGVEVVYLTARDVDRGNEAVTALKKEGLKPYFHQLEVTDKYSVKAFAEYLKLNHGGLDILINNAGIVPNDYFEVTYEDSKKVIDVNYGSLLVIQEYLFPVLKDNARVINISSDCGHISNIKNPYWIQRLAKDNIRREDVDAFTNWFLDSVKTGTLNKEDFVEMSLLAYRISKIALCALTRVLQNEIGRGISVNSLHPGFVQTDLTRGLGILTMEEAGKAPAYLALDVNQSVKGKFFWHDKTEKDWADATMPLYCTFGTFEKFLKQGGL